jgi:dipeptidyl aminopeptidase/acylaminoacyl peptidase
MGALSGKDGLVTWGGDDYNVVDWSFDVATDMVDVSMSGTDWKEYVAGLTGATGKLTVRCDPAEHNDLIIAALPPITAATCVFKVNDTYGFSASAFLSGMSTTNTASGSVDVSFNAQVTGAVTPVGWT